MKTKSVALMALAGMLLTSVSVYSLTPAGGVSIGSDPTGGSTGAGEQLGDEQTDIAGVNEIGRFIAGSTLMVEGRVGHPKLLRGARGDTFVMLEVRGTDAGKATVNPSVNLAIVMDRSGSMKGSRLQNAIRAATQAVDRLNDGDVVSVLAFDTRTSVVVSPTVIDGRARERINSDIRRITLGGDTCISCGIEDGILEIERTMGKVNRMVVLSDGDANHGVRDLPGFRSIAQRARDRAIPITTIGVDVDYNEQILSALSQESNGRHYFVENDAALARVFESEAESLTSTVASSAEAAIELAPGVELDRVFDRGFRRSGGRVIVPLGSFSRGEVKTVLLKVRLPASAVSGGSDGDTELPIASVDLDYQDLVAGSDGKCSGKLAALVTAKPGDGAGELDPIVEGRFGRSETASALKEANSLFAQGKSEDARRRLTAQVQRTEQAAATAKPRAAAGRAPALDRDFESQIQALNEANSQFATPPPPPAGAAAGPAPAQSREGKGAVKRNVERADSFGF